MPFLRILLVLVAVLAAIVVGLALLRPDPEAEPAPPSRVESETPGPRPAVAPPTFQPDRQVMTPADASSPAEITAQEAAEAQARLEKEQQEEMMGAP